MSISDYTRGRSNDHPRLYTIRTYTQSPPSWETLKIVALQRAVPFMGFGFMDNGVWVVLVYTFLIG